MHGDDGFHLGRRQGIAPTAGLALTKEDPFFVWTLREPMFFFLLLQGLERGELDRTAKAVAFGRQAQELNQSAKCFHGSRPHILIPHDVQRRRGARGPAFHIAGPGTVDLEDAYLAPRNLGILVHCDDGFIKALACTCFLTQKLCPERVILAPNASHIFQAYTAVADILRNQKRQMIGQTIVHLLVDKYLKQLPLEQKLNLAETLREKERTDPNWLKRFITAHLQEVRYFWRLFPDLLTFRFQRLSQLNGARTLIHFPAALAGFLLALMSGWLAFRFLKQGATEYWPDTRSAALKKVAGINEASALQTCPSAPSSAMRSTQF